MGRLGRSGRCQRRTERRADAYQPVLLTTRRRTRPVTGSRTCSTRHVPDAPRDSSGVVLREQLGEEGIAEDVGVVVLRQCLLRPREREAVGGRCCRPTGSRSGSVAYSSTARPPWCTPSPWTTPAAAAPRFLEPKVLIVKLSRSTKNCGDPGASGKERTSTHRTVSSVGSFASTEWVAASAGGFAPEMARSPCWSIVVQRISTAPVTGYSALLRVGREEVLESGVERVGRGLHLVVWKLEDVPEYGHAQRVVRDIDLEIASGAVQHTAVGPCCRGRRRLRPP